jgi:O6-methylguanine-DNA--protein-cysteine methyltransferase
VFISRWVYLGLRYGVLWVEEMTFNQHAQRVACELIQAEDDLKFAIQRSRILVKTLEAMKQDSEDGKNDADNRTVDNMISRVNSIFNEKLLATPGEIAYTLDKWKRSLGVWNEVERVYEFKD